MDELMQYQIHELQKCKRFNESTHIPFNAKGEAAMPLQAHRGFALCECFLPPERPLGRKGF
jgi:hypothetical protein